LKASVTYPTGYPASHQRKETSFLSQALEYPPATTSFPAISRHNTTITIHQGPDTIRLKGYTKTAVTKIKQHPTKE